MSESEDATDYTSHLQIPLKLVAFYDWFPKADSEIKFMANYIYLAFVSSVFVNVSITLMVNLYFDFTDIFMGLEIFSDALPYFASCMAVSYFAVKKSDMYVLDEYMKDNFKFRSARGLTNMTMEKAMSVARSFSRFYTISVFCSTSMYAALPLWNHWRTDQPLHTWFYVDVTSTPLIILAFLRQLLAQTLMGLALGQLGVFFASNSIVLCGQLDLLCCSLRNVRFTALLQNGVQYGALAGYAEDILNDERHNYLYNNAVAEESMYNYNQKVNPRGFKKTVFDIYDSALDTATARALRAAARLGQAASQYRRQLDEFVSPLLAVRVVQVTLYMCPLLYNASRKLDMVSVEYLLAVAFDIFIYCYYGNQIILQASRVSTAAYQSSWPALGAAPRRLLLNLLLATGRSERVRAGGFLTMDLHTYVKIIKTSFSYYTLLINVKEH